MLKTGKRYLLVPQASARTSEMPQNASDAVSRSDTGVVENPQKTYDAVSRSDTGVALLNVRKVHIVNHEATHGFCAFKFEGHNQGAVIAWDHCSRGRFWLEFKKRYNLLVKVSHGSSSSQRGLLKRPANRLRMIHTWFELGRVKAAAGGQCANQRAGSSAHM